MKNVIVYLFVLCLPFAGSAQSLNVQQVTEPCSKGEQPAFRMLIPQAVIKTVSPDWERYLKTKSKAKPEEMAGELVLYGAVNKNVAPDGFNVISKLLETTDGVVLTAWFMRSDSAFMSRGVDGNQALAVEKYLLDFGVPQYREIVKGQLKDENKKLSDLENELKGMIKDEEKSNDKINQNNRSIERTQTDIRTNVNDQKNKQEQIAKQKAVVESLKATPGDAYKEAEKTLKGMENELKKLVNENEKLNRQIDKWEKEIREEGRNIDRSKQDQSLKNTQIAQQQAVVKALETKLSNIR